MTTPSTPARVEGTLDPLLDQIRIAAKRVHDPALSNIAQLNEAAWIGERVQPLVDEIDRLRAEKSNASVDRPPVGVTAGPAAGPGD